MSTQQHTRYEIRDGAAYITLDRPEKRNALSGVMVKELYEHLNAAGRDERVRSIVLTGAGKAFCSGMDLNAPPGKASDGERPVSFDELLESIWNFEKPVVAAVNGAAFAGGLGLVGASDVVVAAEEATFSFSEVRLGLVPALISVVCVPKLGTHNAMRLFLTGERFDGREAVRLGLVHRAVPADGLECAVASELDAINRGGPVALVECKKLVRRMAALSAREGFVEAGPWSRRMFESDEGREGMAAFREKRQPNWLCQ